MVRKGTKIDTKYKYLRFPLNSHRVKTNVNNINWRTKNIFNSKRNKYVTLHFFASIIYLSQYSYGNILENSNHLASSHTSHNIDNSWLFPRLSLISGVFGKEVKDKFIHLRGKLFLNEMSSLGDKCNFQIGNVLFCFFTFC